ncbi:MAG: phosphoribosylanthranilate isomerase [Chromatiales bacterium]|nr:phosphoribosylanthranilate isomerase [Chromatiales bacterium]
MPLQRSPLPPHVIQVAGVRDAADARAIVAAGVDWIGFPFGLDHHAEDLPLVEAAAIVQALPPGVRPVLITYVSEPAAVVALAESLGVTAVQLHGPMAPAAVAGLRQLRPAWLLMKSIVVGRDDVSSAGGFAAFIDAFLTDTYDPSTGASGATGLTHDWALSAALARQLDRPLVLAGGLNPGNVAEGIRAVGPWGVDVHTGVEDAAGAKCPERLARFVAAARRAWEGEAVSR